MAAAILRQGAMRRIGGSVLQRTTMQAAATSPAVAEERRRQLVPRGRMYMTDEELVRATLQRLIDKKLRERVDRLNRLKRHHQLYWELIKMFPARKIFNVVVRTTALGILISAEKKKKQEQ